MVCRRRWRVAILLAVSGVLATGCAKNCAREQQTANRLSGSIAVSTTNLMGSGSFVVDRLDAASDLHPEGLSASFDATADAVEVDFFRNAYDIQAVLLVAVDAASTAGGTVKLCTCPADHPLMRASLAQGGGDCSATDVHASPESVPEICDTLDATLTVITHVGRTCQSHGDNSACAEKLDVDVTVPPKVGAPFSGSFSVRHEIAAVPETCPWVDN